MGQYLDTAHVADFLNAALTSHSALVGSQVLCGLFSPELEGEPHRPHSLAHAFLAVSDVLRAKFHETSGQEEPSVFSFGGITPADREDHTASFLSLQVAAQRALHPAWWECFGPAHVGVMQ